MENETIIKLLVAVIVTIVLGAGAYWVYTRKPVAVDNFTDDDDDAVDEGLRIAAESIVETILAEDTLPAVKVKKRKRETLPLPLENAEE